ncbi:hypothetical protein A5777_18710 [Gordonia sp. 852002-10350_SCH5691597]|nr:hypothetical protein A5766_08755 [Gordonia sp. 852002-51296_SCH5728562-b]OBA66095.1 hypothetical protein A5777_18710 [Gordonia sp. 852002-10350_SCH5691597]
MLPTRSQLRTWNPPQLHQQATSVTTAGAAVHGAVVDLEEKCQSLPELRGWSGRAHDAAVKMFGRASDAGSALSDEAGDIGRALSDCAEPLTKTRNALQAKADELDSGDLEVTDAWVVLLKARSMTVEKAEALHDRAISEQIVLNELLLAVGDADDAASNSLLSAAEKHGFEIPNPLIPIPGLVRPRDEVPNPRSLSGLHQQVLVRAEDMAVTVREASESLDEQGNKVKTLFMQDGSRQIMTEMNPYRGSVASQRMNEVVIKHLDKDGQEVSVSSSWEEFDGTKINSTKFSDGTLIYAQEWADGYREARVTTADGRSGLINSDSSFFTHPVPSAVGGALSGIQTHADRGGGLPMISSEQVSKVGAGAKFAGPAIGVATTIYDVATAESGDKCDAAISGALGVVGGVVGGAAGAGLGAAAAGGGAVPGAIGGSTLGGWAGGWIGTKVGAVVCP